MLHPILFKRLLNKLKRYYTFRQEFNFDVEDDEYQYYFLTIWSNKTITFQDTAFIGCCMANHQWRPISIKTFLDNFNELIVHKNRRLLKKLYRQEYIRVIKGSRFPDGFYDLKTIKRTLWKDKIKKFVLWFKNIWHKS